MSAEVLEIVRGISTVLANTYDGALDENGEPIKTGLRREEGDPILDKRIIDGFNGSIQGNSLIIKYHGEIHLKEVHGGKFEDEIAQRIQDIANYIKKEYKKVTGNALTLTKEDKEPDVLVQSMSRIRSWVQANQKFKIGGIPDQPQMGKTVDERLNDTFKKFLGFDESVFPGAQKPKNVKGKRDEEPRE